MERFSDFLNKNFTNLYITLTQFKDMKLSIIYILLLHLTCSKSEKFDFFITENRVKTGFSEQKPELLEVEFDYKSTLTLADDIKACLTSLQKPFKLKASDIEARSNPITLHISDLANWASKFDLLAKGLVKVVKSVPIFTKIKSDRQVLIGMDKDYITQKLSDIQATTLVIAQNFKDKKDINTLIADNTLNDVKVTLQLLNNDVGELFYGYQKFYNMLTLMSQHFMTDNLRILLLNGQPIKQSGYKFMEKGKIENQIFFYVKAINLLQPYKYKTLIPIPYNKVSLEDNYYVEYPSNIIKKTLSVTGLTSNKSLPECLGGLNGKIYDRVVKHCIFVNNRQTYHEIHKGIYLFDIQQSQIAKINEQFGLKIKKATMPSFLQFDGTLQLDNAKGSVTFEKENAETILTESSLPADVMQQIKSIFKPIKDQHKEIKNFILKYLEEEYDIVLLNLSVLSVITAIFLILKKTYIQYKNSKSKNRPINIELNKIARKPRTVKLSAPKPKKKSSKKQP